MATLQQALDQARANPNSPFATELRRRIEAGLFDEQALAEGIDLPGRTQTTLTPSQQESQPQLTAKQLELAEQIGGAQLGVQTATEPVAPTKGISEFEFKAMTPEAQEKFKAQGGLIRTEEPRNKLKEAVIGEFEKGAAKIGEIERKAALGEVPLAEARLTAATELPLIGIKAIWAPVGELLKEPISAGIEKINEKMLETGREIAQEKVDRGEITAEQLEQEAQNFAQANKEMLIKPYTDYKNFYDEQTPRVKNILDGLFNIGELATEIVGFGTGKRVVKEVAEEAVEQIPKGIKMTGDFANKIKEQSAKIIELKNKRASAKNQARITKIEKELDKFVTEVLQPPTGVLKQDIFGEVPLRGVEEARKVIKQADDFSDINTQLKTVGDSSINEVDRIIELLPPTDIGEDYLAPLKNRITELAKDAKNERLVKKYNQILEAETKNLENAGGIFDLKTAQEMKKRANKDLSNFFTKTKEPTPIEAAEIQARNLIREGLMKEIEKAGFSHGVFNIGDLNRTYAGLSDAQAWLGGIEASLRKKPTPTMLQQITERIPFISDLLQGRVQRLPSHAGDLINILPQRTKEIEKLRKQLEKRLGEKITLEPTSAKPIKPLDVGITKKLEEVE